MSRRAWTSRTASQVGRKRTGAGVSGSGSGACGRSKRSPWVTSPSSGIWLGFMPRPVGDLGSGGRPEARQIAADEVPSCVVGVDVRRPEPGGCEFVEVRAPALPGARGRDAHEVDAARLLLADQRVELRAFERPIGVADRVGRASARLADRDRQRPVVGARHQVDRAAHERPLDDLAILKRFSDRVPLEVLDARPEPDVHRRRVLRLQAAHRVERLGNRDRPPLEKALASEQGTVESARAQHYTENRSVRAAALPRGVLDAQRERVAAARELRAAGEPPRGQRVPPRGEREPTGDRAAARGEPGGHRHPLGERDPNRSRRHVRERAHGHEPRRRQVRPPGRRGHPLHNRHGLSGRGGRRRGGRGRRGC